MEMSQRSTCDLEELFKAVSNHQVCHNKSAEHYSRNHCTSRQLAKGFPDVTWQIAAVIPEHVEHEDISGYAKRRDRQEEANVPGYNISEEI